MRVVYAGSKVTNKAWEELTKHIKEGGYARVIPFDGREREGSKFSPKYIELALAFKDEEEYNYYQNITELKKVLLKGSRDISSAGRGGIYAEPVELIPELFIYIESRIKSGSIKNVSEALRMQYQPQLSGNRYRYALTSREGILRVLTKILFDIQSKELAEEFRVEFSAEDSSLMKIVNLTAIEVNGEETKDIHTSLIGVGFEDYDVLTLSLMDQNYEDPDIFGDAVFERLDINANEIHLADYRRGKTIKNQRAYKELVEFVYKAVFYASTTNYKRYISYNGDINPEDKGLVVELKLRGGESYTEENFPVGNLASRFVRKLR